MPSHKDTQEAYGEAYLVRNKDVYPAAGKEQKPASNDVSKPGSVSPPGEPSDTFSAGQQRDCNFLKDLEPEPPN